MSAAIVVRSDVKLLRSSPDMPAADPKIPNVLAAFSASICAMPKLLAALAANCSIAGAASPKISPTAACASARSDAWLTATVMAAPAAASGSVTYFVMPSPNSEILSPVLLRRSATSFIFLSKSADSAVSKTWSLPSTFLLIRRPSVVGPCPSLEDLRHLIRVHRLCRLPHKVLRLDYLRTLATVDIVYCRSHQAGPKRRSFCVLLPKTDNRPHQLLHFVRRRAPIQIVRYAKRDNLRPDFDRLILTAYASSFPASSGSPIAILCACAMASP